MLSWLCLSKPFPLVFLSVPAFVKAITGIPSHCRRYKLMFESFLDDMSCPKQAKNDPYRQEPATITDTGVWV